MISPESRQDAGPEQGPAPLADPVGQPAAEHHRDRAAGIGDHRDPADLHVADAELLDDRRQEQQHAEARRDDADIVQRQQQHFRIPERAQHADPVRRLDLPVLARYAGSTARNAARRLSQCALAGRVGQIEEGDNADQHGRDRFENVHHLPAVQTPQPVEPEQRGRNRRAAGDRDRQGQREPGLMRAR